MAASARKRRRGESVCVCVRARVCVCVFPPPPISGQGATCVTRPSDARSEHAPVRAFSCPAAALAHYARTTGEKLNIPHDLRTFEPINRA